jgi:hypothetical protein
MKRKTKEITNTESRESRKPKEKTKFTVTLPIDLKEKIERYMLIHNVSMTRYVESAIRRQLADERIQRR